MPEEQGAEVGLSPLPFTLDMNDRVRVRLTPRGEEILRDQYEGRLGVIEVDADGYAAFQLWRLMMIFGPHIRLNYRPPFEGPIVVGPDF